jgi:DNA-binding transcriptional MerR regulator
VRELSHAETAQLLGISKSQLYRYGDDGRITYRPHGPKGRRRYTVDQLQIEAQQLQLLFDEVLLRQFLEKKR